MRRYIRICMCLTLSLMLQGSITAQTQFTLKFKNNTGSRLIKKGEVVDEEVYTINKGLSSMDPGETQTLTYTINDEDIRFLILTLGEIPMFTYTFREESIYQDFPITLAAMNFGVRENPMILDNYRASDFDPVDFCAGGNEGGFALFCIREGITITINGGGPNGFMYSYDKDYSIPEPYERPNTALLTPIQIHPKSDQNSAVTGTYFPFDFDVSVETNGYDPSANTSVSNPMPVVQDWLYSAETKSLYVGDEGSYLDYCLGMKNLAAGGTIRTEKCSEMNAKQWVFVDGQFKSYENPNYCIQSGTDSKLYLKKCSSSNTNQQWEIGLAGGGIFKYIRHANATTKIMTIADGSSDHGSNAEIDDLQYSFDQGWFVYDQTFKQANDASKCLDLTSSKTANGTNIQLWDCNGTRAQEWVYDVKNQFIRSRINGNKCIDLVNGNTTKGTNVQLYDCVYTSAKSNMQWVVDGISTTMLDGDQLRMHFAKDPSKCFDFKNAATANGTNIILYNCHYSNSQYLKFEGEQIKMASSGKCVDVKSGSTSNGANIQLYTCNGSDAQQWIYDGFTNAFRLKKNMNKCLDVSGGNTSNGTNIQLWECNGSDAQKWYAYK